MNAYVWPIETLALLLANARPQTKYDWQRRANEFLKTNSSFRRYVLRELEDRSAVKRGPHRWYGSRQVATMLEILHRRAQVAIVGRRGGERVWDLAERWYPETDTVPLREAEQLLQERRFRAAGVRLVSGEWHAHPNADDRDVGERVTLLSPFDRLIHDRTRTEALFDFTTAWRCTSLEQSASTAITSCRCSAATASSVASSRASIARPAGRKCSVRGATRRESTRRSRASRRSSARPGSRATRIWRRRRVVCQP